MRDVATAELQAPASFEQLVDDKPQLGIFNPEHEINEISREITRLIPDLGVMRNVSLSAVQEIHYTNGSAELHFLSGAPDTEDWNTKSVEAFGTKPAEALQMEIDKAIASYEQSINWDATGV